MGIVHGNNNLRRKLKIDKYLSSRKESKNDFGLQDYKNYNQYGFR